jgi:hypothetical protein
MLRRRYLFPGIYITFFLPMLMQTPYETRAALCAIIFVVALVINGRAIMPLVLLIITSLITLIPFLFLVQAAVCSSSDQSTWLPLVVCTVKKTLGILLNIGLLSSVLLLVAANEWHGSLVASINRMMLPRTIRIMAIVSGAMIGEFRRAVLRVHHAYTARGEAMPSVHWRNLVVLPGMLGAVWASVLNGAAERLRGQWSAERFWERYVPLRQPQAEEIAFSDHMVLGAAGLVITILLASRLL